MQTSDNLNNTYVLGSIKSLLDSKRLFLTNKKFLDKRISLYNLKETFDHLKSTGNYVEVLKRHGDTDDFIFRDPEKRLGGFNIIIYLNHAGDPIGFTEFINPQGVDNNIKLDLIFNTEMNSLNIISTVSSSLYSARKTSKDKKRLYTEHRDSGSGFARPKDCRDTLSSFKGRNVFDSNLENLVYSGEIKACLAGNKVIVSDGRGELSARSLGIRRNIDLNSEVEFEDYDFSQYFGDIVMIGTRKQEGRIDYGIRSVTKKNRFGKEIVYTKSPLGYFSLPEETESVLYFSGHYSICRLRSGEIKAWNIQSQGWEIGEKYPVVLGNKLVYVSQGSLTSIIDNIPGVQDTYGFKDLSSLLDFKLYRVHDSWTVFTHRLGDREVKTYFGPFGTVTLDISDKVFVLNNLSLIVTGKDGYTFYKPNHEWIGVGRESTEGMVTEKYSVLPEVSVLRDYRRFPLTEDLNKTEVFGSVLGLIFLRSSDPGIIKCM